MIQYLGPNNVGLNLGTSRFPPNFFIYFIDRDKPRSPLSRPRQLSSYGLFECCNALPRIYLAKGLKLLFWCHARHFGC